MREIHVVVRGSEDEPLTQMAVAALEATAAQRGLQLTVRVVPDGDVGEAALFVADALGGAPPGGAPASAITATRAEAVRHTRDLLARIVPEEPVTEEVESPPEPEPVEAPPSVFLVGVTSCPTGVAHTFMAAEALRRGATALGYEIAVETRGSVGASNELTPEQIARADAVVVAADANVETSRFAGKRLLETGTKAAIHDAQSVIEEALALPEPAAGSAAEPAAPARPARTGVYKHLMTGVSHMLPLVVAGGLMIALGFAVGGIYAGEAEGTLGWALMQIGASAAFALFVPILAGFIAFSIADRPGLTPGLIGGMLAASVGAGFLGGIVAGFLAGYLTRWLNQTIKLPENLQGLKPVLILPLLSSLVVGLAMIFLIGPPVKALLVAMTAWLSGMQTGSALVLGVLLGAMMAFDMGGPINKAAYTFAVGMVSNEVYAPMAAVMAAGMTPPLGLALAATLFKNRFTVDEQRAAKAAGVLGLSFITEGAIPFAAADPIRVIPSIAIGSAVSGALSMMWGCQLLVPHGGIFVLAIPNAITHAMLYLAAILAGTATTAVALYVLKRPQPLQEPEPATAGG